MSISELARRTGLSATAISNLENGYTSDILLSHAVSLSHALLKTCGKPTPLGVGWIAHLFYSSMCMLLLILYTYYDIVDVWKTNIDIQTQQYL